MSYTNVKWPEGQENLPLQIKQLIIRQNVPVTTRPAAIVEGCEFLLEIDAKINTLKVKEKLFSVGVEAHSNFDAIEKLIKWFSQYKPVQAETKKKTGKKETQSGDPLFG